MEGTSYPPPVHQLLIHSSRADERVHNWPNYLELGLGQEHIPDLIRMATDEGLRSAGSGTREAKASIHALRALGQLRAQTAIEPLLGLFEEWILNDRLSEELPAVYGMIGPAAIPLLAAYLADDLHEAYARADAMESLVNIGTMHPEAKDECIAVLVRQLELLDENDPEINGFLISKLKGLDAREALPVIERALKGWAVSSRQIHERC